MKVLEGKKSSLLVDIGSGLASFLLNELEGEIDKGRFVAVELGKIEKPDWSRVEVVRATALKLPFNGNVDLILSTFVLSYAKQREEFLKQVLQALKPGGAAIFLEHKKDSPFFKKKSMDQDRELFNRYVLINELLQRYIREGEEDTGLALLLQERAFCRTVWDVYAPIYLEWKKKSKSENRKSIEKLRKKYLKILKKDMITQKERVEWYDELAKKSACFFSSSSELARLLRKAGFKVEKSKKFKKAFGIVVKRPEIRAKRRRLLRKRLRRSA